MKFASLFQYISAFLIAGLLIFLFSHSQLDTKNHQKVLIDIQSLLEHDSRIKHQLSELQSGYKKNYGGLVGTITQINQILNRLTDLDKQHSLTNNLQSSKKLVELKQNFESKKDNIDLFKRDHAVLKNSLHYMPKLINQLGEKIDTITSMDRNQKIQIQYILNSFLVELLRFNSQINTDKKNLSDKLEFYKSELDLITPETLKIDIRKTFNHAELIIKLHSSTSIHVTEILSNTSTQKIKTLYQEFNENFQLEDNKANSYRVWLLGFSLLLLVYLAIVFVKLQRTSIRLKNSVFDLEFHKYAIDEHSIVSITDVKGNILYANKKFCDISQFSIEELIGKNHRLIRSDIHDKEYFKQMWKTISNGNKWHGVFANRAKDGSIYWVDSTILPRLNPNGKPYQYIGIRTDITAQKNAEEKAEYLARLPAENPDPVLRLDGKGLVLYANSASNLILQHWNITVNQVIPEEWTAVVSRCISENKHEEHELKVDNIYYSILFTPVNQNGYINLYARKITDIKLAEQNLNYQATHDQLTKLTNRYAFELKLMDSLKQAHINNVYSILLYIDLDQFKIVNDTCGHIAGDELLRQISHVFSAVIRENDTLARLGGDEFGVILNNCDTEHGIIIAEKVLAAVNDFRFLWDDKSFEVGASIGLVEITNQSDSTVSLLGEADIACYAAKDAGRNRVKIYQQDNAISKRKKEMQWVSIIPQALAENKFVLYAQLIKSLDPSATNHSHYEILIRLINEAGDIIPPGAFIPAAERYGLMNSVDMWVINRALEMLGEHNQSANLSPMRIAINLSGQSLGNKHLIDFIPTLFDKYNVDASCITFEITETSAITHLTIAIKFIKKLKALGCQFALDDFGSGLSSFAYLKNLPVNFLKIDGAFVKDILDDPIDEAMVQSINQIGHVMNIQTIAEFVESEKIEQRLVEMKVDYVQGYGIEKPRPFTEILEQAKEKHKPVN